MKINTLMVPFPHIIIDDFFDSNECELIFNEILSLKDKFVGPEETEAAYDQETQNYYKKGNGLFVDYEYEDRDQSPILKFYTKLLFCSEMQNAILDMGVLFKYYYPITNYDFTLLQSYGNGDYYLPHQDKCMFTIVTLMYKEPKKYDGGHLVFTEFDDYCPELKNNQTIIFPSRITHKVTPVLKDCDKFETNRFTITKFLHYKTMDNEILNG